jgi:hypothetical protein
MIINSNESLINRNAKIGQITSIAGLLVLGGGLYISFTRPEQFGLSWGALLIGFVLSQIGLYFGNRWGRSPRPDEVLNQSLKGLDRNYTLFHYRSPASHVLVGPAGVWVLLPRHQGGRITYEKGRWKHRGGGIGFQFRKFFAQEGLGRPDLEIPGELTPIQKMLNKAYSEEDAPQAQAVLIFTNPNVVVEADDAAITTLPAKKLKDFIRKQAKQKNIPSTQVDDVKRLISGEKLADS